MIVIPFKARQRPPEVHQLTITRFPDGLMAFALDGQAITRPSDLRDLAASLSTYAISWQALKDAED